jgi:hypothetical protein
MSKARLVITAVSDPGRCGRPDRLAAPGASRPVPGRIYAGTSVLLLARDLSIRILDAATGELLRDLALDPARDYQPTGRPPGPPPGTPRKRSNPEP